ncbi:MAG: hydroxymethylbilane synthase [Phototrophicaceae bacterium]
MQTIRIGTRGSKLALWQADYVADLLRQQYPTASIERVIFTTRGDKILDKSLPSIGGKGLFTEELEAALLNGDIDCAVHSLKDLPTQNPYGLTIGAVPERAPVEDVLISRHHLDLDTLPTGATIGTSSLRRAAQVRHVRPDIIIIDIRGNVPTRIQKALQPESAYDAIILAQAGVERLGLMQHVTQILSNDVMLPAPGQGAIGIQSRDDNADLFEPLTDLATLLTVTAERSFLQRLQGGCSVPVAAYSTYKDDTLTFIGRVASVDGKQWIEVTREATALASTKPFIIAEEVGRYAAVEALAKGAKAILDEVKA